LEEGESGPDNKIATKKIVLKTEREGEFQKWEGPPITRRRGEGDSAHRVTWKRGLFRSPEREGLVTEGQKGGKRRNDAMRKKTSWHSGRTRERKKRSSADARRKWSSTNYPEEGAGNPELRRSKR